MLNVAGCAWLFTTRADMLGWRRITRTVPARDKSGWTTFIAEGRRQILASVRLRVGAFTTATTTKMLPFTAPGIRQVTHVQVKRHIVTANLRVSHVLSYAITPFTRIAVVSRFQMCTVELTVDVGTWKRMLMSSDVEVSTWCCILLFAASHSINITQWNNHRSRLSQLLLF